MRCFFTIAALLLTACAFDPSPGSPIADDEPTTNADAGPIDRQPPTKEGDTPLICRDDPPCCWDPRTDTKCPSDGVATSPKSAGCDTDYQVFYWAPDRFTWIGNFERWFDVFVWETQNAVCYPHTDQSDRYYYRTVTYCSGLLVAYGPLEQYCEPTTMTPDPGDIGTYVDQPPDPDPDADLRKACLDLCQIYYNDAITACNFGPCRPPHPNVTQCRQCTSNAYQWLCDCNNGCLRSYPHPT
jgi:hypothetical protein